MGRGAEEKLAPKVDTRSIDWDAKVAAAHAVIDEAIAQYQPTHIFALFSGGHDSLSSVHVTSLHPAFSGVVHINTGIGVEETRTFVRETCAEQGWELKEYHPPVSYREIVLEHGFPGPAGHFFAYTRLKERCIRQLVREHKAKRMDRIMLVTGVRTSESVRRMRHVDQIQKEFARIWVAPIYDWTKPEMNAYIEHVGLRRSQVVDLIHMSGECLCGAFAKSGEMEELELWFPETAARIRSLEAEVAERGIKACVWGKRPPKMTEADAARQRIDLSLPMCTSCASDRLLSDSDEPEESCASPDGCAGACAGCAPTAA
jgi:3'-phosphoadenosine 5'-phosphosulfate sulfotransferase (PAPS reductase)/FAD synthetase